VTLACIGLGSNLGDSLAVMREARDALAARPGCRLRASSAIYRSGAVGPGEQPDYLNAALAIDTQLTAAALLDILLELEQRAGRVRGERWGPRTLDLDLLLYGDEHIDSSRLRSRTRAFSSATSSSNPWRISCGRAGASPTAPASKPASRHAP
jgi:2-amino-4-hydroxy-6-hydroxymethyldihydropteridine diphosphokinase